MQLRALPNTATLFLYMDIHIHRLLVRGLDVECNLTTQNTLRASEHNPPPRAADNGIIPFLIVDSVHAASCQSCWVVVRAR
jgi:hypothetical protein